MEYFTLKKHITDGGLDTVFEQLYSARAGLQKERYLKALDGFASLYGRSGDIRLFSAPGRTEICGNHTDHNHGKVAAAAVNLDVIAVVRTNSSTIINLCSEGHSPNLVNTADLVVREDEKNHSNALIRGICARFTELGYKIGGFDAFTTSDVLSGSGLSSSAAFELLTTTILGKLFNENSPEPICAAQISQYAENRYFGKPCGLMDQTASAVGGAISIDFRDPAAPVVKSISLDLEKAGYRLCIVDTGGSHSDLTGEYAAITEEMSGISRLLGVSHLREADEDEFYKVLGNLRGQTTDRALTRACHFFAENKRVSELEQAAAKCDFNAFLDVISRSGRSSFMYLQNVFAASSPCEQGLSVGLAVIEHLLNGQGAFRVHGGGFAGTIQAFVPKDMENTVIAGMELLFGTGCAMILDIRRDGAVEIALS